MPDNGTDTGSSSAALRLPPIRWGIAGPGRIAAKLAADLALVEGTTLAAVGSRSAERARAFADEHGGPGVRAHGDYRALVDDADVDVVYIATPHPQHAALAVACLEAGKAVLVEKSFTATLAGAWRVVDTARTHQVFAMEAMWTRFQPAVVRLRELIAQGAIGEPRSVQADLGTVRDVDPTDRLFSPELGGGALLDLGVYPVSFAQMVLGTPDRVHAVATRESTGVDADGAMLLGFPDGRTATLHTSFHSPTPGQARVFGTTGWIDVLPRFHHPSVIVLHHDGDDEGERIELPATGSGLYHELVEVTDCLRAGATESTVMPLDDTLAVQGVLAEAADQLNLVFREDDTVL
jgi:predicted dehydrogenase